MTKKRSVQLLVKTAFVFLIFIVIAFFLSGKYLIQRADKYIDETVEHSFFYREKHIVKYLEEYGYKDHLKGSYIKKLDTIPVNLPNERCYDTLIYIEDLDVYHLNRVKRKTIEINGEYYQLAMGKNIQDFTSLKADVVKTLIPSFIILAFILLLFSLFLSGFLMQPFNKVLEQMRKFKVGKNLSIIPVNTSTKEFVKMQDLFHEMVNRTEDDYQKLKEYTENMAHEIQTPLAVIRNKTEHLISDENIMDKHASNVKAIYDESNHLSKLGATLNLLTKIENNEFKNSEELLTKGIINKHVDAVEELAGLKSIKILKQLNEQHAITIDPFLLDIILKNLLKNAITYSQNDTEIKVETDENSFRISNTGEKLTIESDNIFKRFSRGSENKASLGLGLAIVKRICDLNQLTISYNFKDSKHVFNITNQS